MRVFVPIATLFVLGLASVAMAGQATGIPEVPNGLSAQLTATVLANNPITAKRRIDMRLTDFGQARPLQPKDIRAL